MALAKEQQNLINDLKAPIKSFRIFALEEAIKTGASQEVLDCLVELSDTETDGECQMLISHAITSVKNRLSGSAPKTPAKKIKEQEDFLEAWQKADDNGKLQLLTSMPGRLPKGLRGMGPELIDESTQTVVAAKVIRVFCRFWPKDKFQIIADYLDSESLSLKLAALKTIVHTEPQLLIDQLPNLLVSRDPQIKALAIRGLVKIDKEEALKHLQALLLSAEVSDRLAGIQNCPFLPFEMVKPVLLKYFAAENHPELLIRAGWILEMNPDVQVPFKLFEIAERSPVKKAKLVKNILNEAVKLLEQSGILGDKFAAYTKKLQAWVFKRNSIRFVKQVIAKLGAENPDMDLIQVIKTNLKQNVIRETFEEALNWPIPIQVKEKLKRFLEEVKPVEKVQEVSQEEQANLSAAPVKTAETEDRVEQQEVVTAPVANTPISDEANIEAQISKIASITNEQISLYINELKSIISQKDSPDELKIAGLHTVSRLKHKGFEDLAVKLLNHSNIPLATSAVEYLGIVDPETIFPYLGQCLRVADVRMKSAALGILMHFDFNQAVSSLNAMLKATDPGQQRMAMECIDQFDFALIRDQLTDYLIKCKDPKIMEMGLCHFLANPASENVYALYKVEKSQHGQLNEMVKEVRVKCQKQAGIDELVQEEENSATEQDLENKWKQEQEKKKAQRPAYAYKKKEEQKPQAAEVAREIGSLVQETLKSKGAWFVLGALVIGIGFLVLLFSPGGGAPVKAVKGGAVMAVPIVVEGRIEKNEDGLFTLEATDKNIFLISPGREGFRLPNIGAKLRVSLVPFRRTGKNMYFARIRAMRKISRFSSPKEK